MIDYDNNIVYEKALSTEYYSNIEFLNTKGIHINSNPADWFNVFYLLNPKYWHIQRR